MSGRELFNGVIIAFVEPNSLAFLDLRLDSGFSAKVPSDVILHELLKDRIFDHDAALSRGDVPLFGLHPIAVNNSRIGVSVDVVCEPACSASVGVINASEDVEADRSRLILHAGRIITDGAFVRQAGVESGCWVQMVLDGGREDVRDDEQNVGDPMNVGMVNGSQGHRFRRVGRFGMTFERWQRRFGHDRW